MKRVTGLFIRRAERQRRSDRGGAGWVASLTWVGAHRCDVSSSLRVDCATPRHLRVVTDLLAEAVEWLAERRTDQWPSPYPERIAVRASIDRGDTHVACVAGDHVATLSIYGEDPVFWGARPPGAGYLHRLVVARRAAGQGLGERLIDWAGAHVAAQGRRYLRVDCGAENASIRAYYERLNFQHLGDREVTIEGAGSAKGPWRASLYERSIAQQPRTTS